MSSADEYYRKHTHPQKVAVDPPRWKRGGVLNRLHEKLDKRNLTEGIVDHMVQEFNNIAHEAVRFLEEQKAALKPELSSAPNQRPSPPQIDFLDGIIGVLKQTLSDISGEGVTPVMVKKWLTLLSDEIEGRDLHNHGHIGDYLLELTQGVRRFANQIDDIGEEPMEDPSDDTMGGEEEEPPPSEDVREEPPEDEEEEEAEPDEKEKLIDDLGIE